MSVRAQFVNEERQKEIICFPILAEYVADDYNRGIIVLFATARRGVVVKSSSLSSMPVGSFSDDWHSCEFHTLAQNAQTGGNSRWRILKDDEEIILANSSRIADAIDNNHERKVVV